MANQDANSKEPFKLFGMTIKTIVIVILTIGVCLTPGIAYWNIVEVPKRAGAQAKLEQAIRENKCRKVASDDSIFYKSTCQFNTVSDARDKEEKGFCSKSEHLSLVMDQD